MLIFIRIKIPCIFTFLYKGLMQGNYVTKDMSYYRALSIHFPLPLHFSFQGNFRHRQVFSWRGLNRSFQPRHLTPHRFGSKE